MLGFVGRQQPRGVSALRAEPAPACRFGYVGRRVFIERPPSLVAQSLPK